MANRNARARSEGVLQRIFGRPLPLETPTTVFILLNAIDVCLTWLLLRQGNHFEANPIARYFLYSWGIRGMIYFKFALVAVVTVIAQVVATRRPTTALWLLNGGSLAVGTVVVYSLFLLRNALLAA